MAAFHDLEVGGTTWDVYIFDVSLNGGTFKSSILIGFSIINHPYWGTTILANPQIYKTL